MSTATVTRKLRGEGLPVELVRGNGYHYFIFDDGNLYESHSIMVPRFRSQPLERWLEIGRTFAEMVKAGTYSATSTYL